MSDYEVTQRRHNILVGIFVLVAAVALVWIIYKFGDLPTAIAKYRSYEVLVQFPTAQGVQKDTSVQYCGYQIGRVSKVYPPQIREDRNTGLRYHQTVVILLIHNDYHDIPSNVEAKLMTRGLGSSYIELKIDPANLPAKPKDPARPETVFLVQDMLLQGSAGMTSEFFPEESQKKLEGLATRLMDMIDNTNEIIGDKKSQEDVKTTLANLAKASGQLNITLSRLEEFLTTSTQASEQLAKTATELRNILEKVNEGKGTAGKLINDGRLYESLLENSEQLGVLMDELKELALKLKEKGLTLL